MSHTVLVVSCQYIVNDVTMHIWFISNTAFTIQCILNCTSDELSVYSERCDYAYMVYIERSVHCIVYSIKYIVYVYKMSNIKCMIYTKHWTLFIVK